MLIACKCLNVQLSAAPSSPAATAAVGNFSCSTASSNGNYNSNDSQAMKATTENVQQNKIKNDNLQHFFEKALGPLTEVKTKIQQIDLIQEIQIEHLNWHLNMCICCDTLTHAVQKDSNLYLLNSILLTNENDINKLKTNSNFSKNFGILLSSTLREQTADSNDNATFKVKTKNLKQHYRNLLENECEATEERIRRFSDQQYKLLNHFREKAGQEYNILLRLLKNVPESFTHIINADGFTNSKVPNLETPPATPESTPMSIGNSPILKHPPELVSAKNSPFGKSKNIPIRHSSNTISTGRISSSVDAEFFFDMDGGGDKIPFSNMSDVEESDIEEENIAEGIAIRQPNRPKSLNIAQSLPISVPTQGERTSIDDDYDEYANAEDIAASIKALAKSVHGDAVFGELPRPRFSTQI